MAEIQTDIQKYQRQLEMSKAWFSPASPWQMSFRTPTAPEYQPQTVMTDWITKTPQTPYRQQAKAPLGRTDKQRDTTYPMVVLPPKNKAEKRKRIRRDRKIFDQGMEAKILLHELKKLEKARRIMEIRDDFTRALKGTGLKIKSIDEVQEFNLKGERL